MPLIAATLSRVPSEDLAHFTEHARAVVRPTPSWASGAIVLETCQRFEVYLDVAEARPEAARLRRLLRSGQSDVACERLGVRTGRGVVQHLFAVAAGLDSIVVGEAEVTGQVRHALRAAEAQATGPLHRLFAAALRAAKEVSSATGVGAVGRSAAGVGLDLIELTHGTVQGRRVVLLGTGSQARLIAAELTKRGCGPLSVYSSAGRAQEFATRHNATAVGRQDLPDALGAAELVVACSGTGRLDPTVLAARAAQAQAAGGFLPVLDLALGGDVERQPGLAVLGLDQIAAHPPIADSEQVAAARRLLASAVSNHLASEQARTAAPAVTAVRGHVEDIVAREVAAAERRYTPEVAAAVRDSLHRVTGSLLHVPSQRATIHARSGHLDDYLAGVLTVFGIEVLA